MRPKKSTGKKVNPEPGVHIARLIQIIDWGTQVDNYAKDGRAKLEFVWELPQSLHVFNEDKGEQPLLVTRKYGNTFGRGSAMKEAVESMLGHKVDADFELDGLLGELCQMNITIEQDGEYENVVIQSLMPLTKDLAKKKFIEYNDQFIFDLDNFDQDTWDKLPEWKQKEIMKSPEYAEVASKVKETKREEPKGKTQSNGKATEKGKVFQKKEPAKAGAGKKGK